uniref:Secretory carrier-associated membrane protein n=1 Tax=Denticeps clupeoides TaxID=299321 RepID=A0AAY4E9C2_9TELE
MLLTCPCRCGSVAPFRLQLPQCTKRVHRSHEMKGGATHPRSTKLHRQWRSPQQGGDNDRESQQLPPAAQVPAHQALLLSECGGGDPPRASPACSQGLQPVDLADSSFNFMAFFFVFFLQCVLALIQAIGISGWGTSGWIATVLFFGTNVGSGVVMLISALLFTVVTLLMGLVLMRVHRLYRGGGGSLENAKEEWSTGLWKSAPAREAGFNAVAETGPSLPQYPTTVPSYPENRPW